MSVFCLLGAPTKKPILWHIFLRAVYRTTWYVPLGYEHLMTTAAPDQQLVPTTHTQDNIFQRRFDTLFSPNR